MTNERPAMLGRHCERHCVNAYVESVEGSENGEVLDARAYAY